MSYFYIAYSSEYYQQLNDDKLQPLRYIGDHTLYDLDTLKSYLPFDTNIFEDVADIIEPAQVTTREKAAEYIRTHRTQYQYIGYDTGRLDRLLCVEISTVKGRDKATAALYEHPQHGLMWLDMY